MESGNIVEYIDRQKIICAVVQQVKEKRLRLLAENNREVNLSITRICHQSRGHINTGLSRHDTVAALKKIAERRQSLTDQIDIKKLWEVLNTEQEWIDLSTMTGLCFSDNPGSDHESAVVRAFFEDRLYFKFGHDCFFPHTESQVEQVLARRREAKRRAQLIENGAHWVKKTVLAQEQLSGEAFSQKEQAVLDLLREFYLHGKEAQDADIAQGILKAAEVDAETGLFDFLVLAGIFSQDENVELLRADIPTAFPADVQQQVETVTATPLVNRPSDQRIDLTQLSTMTIDGPATLDFDDAISIENRGANFRIGIHITDVSHHVKKGNPIDIDAMGRATSIYMPDQKISMLHPRLAEGLCSLKSGVVRPAISTLVDMSPLGEILEYKVLPSLIRVSSQLFYRDVNLSIDTSPSLRSLWKLAEKFRAKRFEANATQISLPEIQLWIDASGDICLNRIDRESPARMMVSELMILANTVMARFLIDNNLPAIFRSQVAPQKQLYKGMEGTLFQNYMQRRYLNRFILGPSPEKHAGLGVDAYVTATSPIRKYSDLVTQRQIRAAKGLETPYTVEEIDRIIASIQQPLSQVNQIQKKRQRYWLLKYLEKRIGQKTKAHVLFKRRNSYQILLPEYMLECALSLSEGIVLAPEDIIEVTLQYANARKDNLSVALG